MKYQPAGGIADSGSMAGSCPAFMDTDLVMLILIPRAPVPDAEVWPGRVGLAAIDALAWPAAWVVAVLNAPWPTGAIGQFVVAVALLSAVSRLYRAIAMNHRYFFTTWTWGRRLLALILVGYAMKLAVWLTGAG